MKKEIKKFNIKHFLKIINDLLRTKIKDIKDVKNFYIGVNNLASEISSHPTLIKKLKPFIYNNDQKLFKEVTYILGYGKVVERSKIFEQTTPPSLLARKRVNLTGFFKKNLQIKNEITIVRNDAKLYFKKITDIDKEELKKIFETVLAPIKEKIEILYEERPNKKLAPSVFEICKKNRKFYISYNKTSTDVEIHGDMLVAFKILHTNYSKENDYVKWETLFEEINKRRKVEGGLKIDLREKRVDYVYQVVSVKLARLLEIATGDPNFYKGKIIENKYGKYKLIK